MHQAEAHVGYLRSGVPCIQIGKQYFCPLRLEGSMRESSCTSGLPQRLGAYQEWVFLNLLNGMVLCLSGYRVILPFMGTKCLVLAMKPVNT